MTDIFCSECGFALEKVGGIDGDTAQSAGLLGIDPSDLTLWHGTVCTECEVVFCPRCRDTEPRPCPNCGRKLVPAFSTYLPSSSRKPPKLLGKGATVAIGVVATLLVIGIVYLWITRNDGSDSSSVKKTKGTTPSESATTRQQPVRPKTLKERLSAIKTLIKKEQREEALKRLAVLSREHPTEPRIEFLRTEAYFYSGRIKEAFASVEAIIRIDPKLQGNSVVHGWIYFIGTSDVGKPNQAYWMRVRTMNFIQQKLDIRAAPTVAQIANAWSEYDLVWRAIAWLNQHKATQNVNFTRAWKLRFHGERSCVKRKQWIQEIIARRDKAALSALMDVVTRESFPHPKSKKESMAIQNGCIQRAAEAAIRKLER
ncbi:hypothetical protein ACFL51_00365 [Myxococcota bacterium]